MTSCAHRCDYTLCSVVEHNVIESATNRMNLQHGRDDRLFPVGMEKNYNLYF